LPRSIGRVPSSISCTHDLGDRALVEPVLRRDHVAIVGEERPHLCRGRFPRRSRPVAIHKVFLSGT
jgi:hypothetical protein